METDTLIYLAVGVLLAGLGIWLVLWATVCWWKSLSMSLDGLSKDVQELRRDMGEKDD